MIETKLKLDAKAYAGCPDLVLCNGACVSFIYEEIYMHVPYGVDYADIELYSEVVLFEYRPPRRVCLDRSPKLDNLPF